MKTTAALIVTAAALLAGGFLLGYGYSELWQEKEPVLVEGWVWRFSNGFVTRQDPYYGRSPMERVEYEVQPFNDRSGWAEEGHVFVYRYSERLPARSREIGLEGLVSIQPAFISVVLFVDGEAAGNRDRHGMINAPATYLVALGGQGYVFAAPNEYEAEEKAKAILWPLLRERLGGDVAPSNGG